MSGAYYNEIDPYAAQWLRNLIKAGHIAPGEVDERSIEDVRPDDLRGFTQCHFFAGIGVWSYALRLAGWPDDRPVWTGSCPCQPFSAAGKGAGFADERHLWPAWAWLVGECRPPVILGEQVASKDIDPWIDLVQADLEAMGYTIGCVPFPSAGVGAPHIRDRAYFMAHANSMRSRRNSRTVRRAQAEVYRQGFEDGREPHGPRIGGAARIVADANGRQRDGLAVVRGVERIEPAGPTNGFWRAADWLLCRDEKWRPVEPGTFPLVTRIADGMGRDGTAEESQAEIPRKDQGNRAGRLRAYGNAINAQAAAEFIRAAREAIDLTA